MAQTTCYLNGSLKATLAIQESVYQGKSILYILPMTSYTVLQYLVHNYIGPWSISNISFLLAMAIAVSNDGL